MGKNRQPLPLLREKKGGDVAGATFLVIHLSSMTNEVECERQNKQRQNGGEQDKRLAMGRVVRISAWWLLYVLWHRILRPDG